jgi:hypothetical protein
MTFAQNVDKRELNFKEETGIWKDEGNKLDYRYTHSETKKIICFIENHERCSTNSVQLQQSVSPVHFLAADLFHI